MIIFITQYESFFFLGKHKVIDFHFENTSYQNELTAYYVLGSLVLMAHLFDQYNGMEYGTIHTPAAVILWLTKLQLHLPGYFLLYFWNHGCFNSSSL